MMNSIRWLRVTVAACALAAATPALCASLQPWDKVITKGESRFKLLKQFGNEAVLDKETGLVWERTPDSTTVNWGTAEINCVTIPIGGRRGWRLPTIWELMSLSDPSADNPSLTPGHPFDNISTVDNYWSSTTDPSDANNALRERFGVGSGGVIIGLKGSLARRWCVRGPGGQYGIP
jgi:Protein of unknown function (DUF1566)